MLRYQPLSAFSGLFRNFAATDPSLDAIKSFADRFGLLGGSLRKRIVLHDQGRGGSHPMGFGEHVDDWVHEILVMRLGVDLGNQHGAGMPITSVASSPGRPTALRSASTPIRICSLTSCPRRRSTCIGL